MKKVIVIFFLTLLIPITSVSGYYCKYSEIAKYKGLAANISTAYSYQEKDNNVTFSITLVNLNEELYIVDTSSNKRYDYKMDEITISDYKPGQTIKYNVYATNENCSSDLLYTIRVNLPDYNPYYSDPLCEGLENYIYCKKWYKHNLSYKAFKDKVETYRKSLNRNITIEEEIESSDENILLKLIIDLWINYYYIILLVIIIVCSIVIYNINKKSNIYK